MSTPLEPRDLRVSDDERAHVISLLQKATGRGLIDLGEFNDRSSAAVAARTRAELNQLLLDLPGLQIAGRSVEKAQVAATSTSGPTPGFSGAPAAAYRAAGPSGPVPPLELIGWGSRSFRGRWAVPALIVLGGMGASTRLDFSEAQLTSPTVTLEFRSNYGGSTELIVPQGTTVGFEGLQMRGGHLKNKVPPGDGGVLHLVLTGIKRAGHITIRYPRQGVFGRR